MKTDLQQKQSSRKQGEIEVVADYGDLCGEGPLWDDQQQILYWTDIDGKKFYRLLWKERRHELVHNGFQVNGACMQQSGGFLGGNNSGGLVCEPKTKTTLLAPQDDGQKSGFNASI